LVLLLGKSLVMVYLLGVFLLVFVSFYVFYFLLLIFGRLSC